MDFCGSVVGEYWFEAEVFVFEGVESAFWFDADVGFIPERLCAAVVFQRRMVAQVVLLFDFGGD